MNFTSKKTLILTLVTVLWTWVLTQGSSALASELNIQDFQMYKDTERGDVSLFYKHIFTESYIVPRTFFPLVDLTASLSEKISQKNMEDSASQAFLKNIKSSTRLFFRNRMRTYALAQAEAASLSDIPLVSAVLSKEKTNTVSPELKTGSNFIKPGLTIINILNTHIHTHVSYQTKEETLEAKLSKKFSNAVELELTNTFTEDRVKKVLLGFSYNF